MRVNPLIPAAALTLCAALAGAPVPVQPRHITARSWAPTNDPDTEFARDVDFFYATLFPDPGILKALGAASKFNRGLPAGIQETLHTNQILGRIFVAMAYGGLKYCIRSNDTKNLQDWKWQLATALAHGQRVVFDLRNSDAFDFYNLLVNGVVKTGFTDPYGRLAASHGFEWSGGELKELKYKGASLVYAVTDGLQGRHHGINIAFGGLGNDRMDHYLVGPGGTAVDPTKVYKAVEGLQHGHLYLHHANHAEGGRVVEGGLMVGLEGSAPGTKNMYGEAHDASSASKDATLERSVDGGQKMQKLLGAAGPAEIGGMWVKLDPGQVRDLASVFHLVDALDPNTRQALFRTLLTDNGPRARADLRTMLRIN